MICPRCDLNLDQKIVRRHQSQLITVWRCGFCITKAKERIDRLRRRVKGQPKDFRMIPVSGMKW